MKLQRIETKERYNVYKCYIDNIVVELAYEKTSEEKLFNLEHEIALCAEYKTCYNHGLFEYGSAEQRLWYALDEFLQSHGITILSVE